MRSILRAEALKWIQTIRISWSMRMAYKVSFVLLVLGPTLVFFFVKYNLWSSIYAMQGVTAIGGYDRRQMIAYQVWVMVVSFLAQGYNAMTLAEDIRLGRISSYLVYPFDFWQFHAAGFVAFQVLQLLVAGVTVAATLAAGLVTLPPLATLASGVALSLLVGVFWFAVSYSVGLGAFWLEETWVLRVMFVTVATFLSGAVIPLDLYPAWFPRLLGFTPFPYVTYVPVKVLMGDGTGVAHAAVVVAAWIVVAWLLAAAIWKRGLALYTAAGM